jgi:RNA polymerase sigma-70 factor (ECF subfamily)
VRFFTARLRSQAAAEDLIQDLYLRLPALEADGRTDNPSALLYRAASNLMLDRMRSERRSGDRERAWQDSRRLQSGGADVADEPSPEQAVVGRERLRRLLEVVASLPRRTRRAFELHKLEGHSHSETARLLGVSQKTVEKQISAALRRITAELADEN